MSLVKDVEHQIPSVFYGMKEADDLYFNVTRVSAQNYDKWVQFAQKHNDASSKIGTGAFLGSLRYYQHPNAEVWVAFVSNKPVINPYKIDESSIEMFVTVDTSEHSVFTSHMGIARAAGTFPKALQHKNISMKLHAFAAKFMLEQHPEKMYMINAPAEEMREIVIDAFKKKGKLDQIFIGDNRTSVPETLTIEIVRPVVEKFQAQKSVIDSKTYAMVVHPKIALLRLLEQQEMINKGEKKASPINIEHEGRDYWSPLKNFTIKNQAGDVVSVITPEEQNAEFAWYFHHFEQTVCIDDTHPIVIYNLRALADIGDLHGNIVLVGREGAIVDLEA